jgi:hypothetical protein
VIRVAEWLFRPIVAEGAEGKPPIVKNIDSNANIQQLGMFFLWLLTGTGFLMSGNAASGRRAEPAKAN